MKLAAWRNRGRVGNLADFMNSPDVEPDGDNDASAFKASGSHGRPIATKTVALKNKRTKDLEAEIAQLTGLLKMCLITQAETSRQLNNLIAGRSAQSLPVPDEATLKAMKDYCNGR